MFHLHRSQLLYRDINLGYYQALVGGKASIIQFAYSTLFIYCIFKIDFLQSSIQLGYLQLITGFAHRIPQVPFLLVKPQLVYFGLFTSPKRRQTTFSSIKNANGKL